MIGKITVTVEANNSNFLTWQNDEQAKAKSQFEHMLDKIVEEMKR